MASNGSIKHDSSHVRMLDVSSLPEGERKLGSKLAADLADRKVILGVFDEGCMGMYNAIIDDEQLNRSGFYKERLSQSALYARMQRIPHDEAQRTRVWLDDRKLHFNTGTGEATQLTDAQILQQCRMYIAALRIEDEFGCDAVGIQYQQGLKDLVPSSDLVEGLLNNPDRPPVRSEDGSRELFAGRLFLTSTKWTSVRVWMPSSRIVAGWRWDSPPPPHCMMFAGASSTVTILSGWGRSPVLLRQVILLADMPVRRAIDSQQCIFLSVAAP